MDQKIRHNTRTGSASARATVIENRGADDGGYSSRKTSRAAQKAEIGVCPLLFPDERYSEQGWGLLQVLQVMSDAPGPQGTLAEFVRAAKETLRRRVSNAPVERNEVRWLAGWLRRLDTYGGVR